MALGRRKEALSCFQQAESIFKAAGMLQPAEASGRLIVRLRDEIEKVPGSAQPDPNYAMLALTEGAASVVLAQLAI